MKGQIFLMVIAAMVILFSGSANAVNLRANQSFSPVEVWGNSTSASDGAISTMDISMDMNGDGKAEIIAGSSNYSSNTYTLYLFNGADGKLINRVEFVDVAYSASGDNVPVDGRLYTVMIADSNGNPISERYYVIFANHSNNRRISIYSLSSTDLSPEKYLGIDLPSTINAGGLSITVTDYKWSVHTYSNGTGARIVVIAYSSGQIYGYTVGKLQIFVVGEDLSIIWDRDEVNPESNGFPTIGADLVDFNGHGVANPYPDIALINLTEDPENTTMHMLNSSNGNELWSLKINGFYKINDPSRLLISSYFFDYNRDNRTEIEIPTIISKGNSTHLNFISSSGSLIGYYNTSVYNSTIMAEHTSEKVSWGERWVRSVDLDGDGYGEIFLVDNNANLVCWDVFRNSTAWVMPIKDSSYGYQILLSTNDIDDDGVWDIYLLGMKDVDEGTYQTKDVNLTGISSASRSVVFSERFTGAVGGYSGTYWVKEISDISGDSLQDALIVQGYFNDGTPYVLANLTSMKDGTVLWSSRIDLDTEDYGNMSIRSWALGDVNGDGRNDVCVSIYYYNDSGYYTHIRILSGTDGSLLWSGDVQEDVKTASILSFEPITVISNWNQFDYNDDGTVNEILVYTGYSVHIFSVSQPVPELAPLAIFLAPAAILLMRRKR